MSDIRMMGAYSGIDMGMVEQIMEAEAAKGVRFTQQKEQYTKSQNAWKDLNTRLDSLYKRLEDLQKPDTFNSKAVNLTGSSSVSASAATTAATGDYRVQVSKLATQTQLTGGRVQIPKTEIDGVETAGTIRSELKLSGEFNVKLDNDETFTIEVTETDSLVSISEKINNSSDNSGIRSSIVDNRLILTHTEYGEKDLNVEGDLAESLGLKGIDINTGSDIDSVKGQNAVFTINGITVDDRASNTISDVVDGVTFNLTNVHNGSESTIISVTEDLNKGAEALQKLVDQYNSTQTYITSQLSVGDPSADNNETGTLVGDGTLMRLQSNLRSMMTSTDSHGTDIKGLQALGVSVDRNGTASFDRSKMEKQVKDNPNAVKDFFSPTNEILDEDGEELRPETKGFSTTMRRFVNQYISSSTGIIKTRRDTYDRMIKDVNNRIEKFEERLEMRKARYIKQFSALDTAMMKAESQMDFMFSQLGMDSK